MLSMAYSSPVLLALTGVLRGGVRGEGNGSSEESGLLWVALLVSSNPSLITLLSLLGQTVASQEE